MANGLSDASLATLVLTIVELRTTFLGISRFQPIEGELCLAQQRATGLRGHFGADEALRWELDRATVERVNSYPYPREARALLCSPIGRDTFRKA